jgi:two-component system, NtrC family, sensor kinase
LSDVLEQVRQLLDGSIDAAVVLDQDRRILFYNRAYEVLSGLRGRQLRKRVADGAHCWEVFPLEICENACIGCKARDAAKALRVDEIRAQRGDGEEMMFIVAAVPLEGGYIIETYRDVTADARIQRRLKVLLDRERRAKEVLEEEISARTKDLMTAQAQLVHQEKMSSLGRLVAGIAHEINNPINFVYGNVDFLGQYMEDLLSVVKLLEDLPLSEELRARIEVRKKEIEFEFLVADSRKLIRSIRSGAERTASIVQDLKTFSRSGGSELQEIDVVSGIETTLNLLAPLLKNRITVEREFQPNLPRLLCNAGHINQVFMNILTNAAQAIRGEGTIRVQVERSSDGGGICVRISDTGPGINPEVMEKMTDPFFTTKDVGEGTGLGLWITENIVRAHGGTLSWQNVTGKGAAFTVELPARAPESARHGLMGGPVRVLPQSRPERKH